MDKEITFIVEQDFEGGYSASSLEFSIITQGDTLEELKLMVKDAVECHFYDEEYSPKTIRLQFVKEELLSV